jgi:hypothetical protein
MLLALKFRGELLALRYRSIAVITFARVAEPNCPGVVLAILVVRLRWVRRCARQGVR